MSSLADTQLFADVPTGLVLLDIAREQLKSFPIIDVVIEGLDQDFSESIAEKHFVTVREFLLDVIAKFGLDLGGLYSAALLYSDDQPRHSRVRHSPVLPTRSACITTGSSRCTPRSRS